MRKRSLKDRLSYDWKHNKSLFVMVSLPLCYLIIFRYIPIPYGIAIAFKDYHPLRGLINSPWVGLKYFTKFFGYYQWKQLIINALVLNLYELLASPVPLMFALLLEHFPLKRYKVIVRTTSFAPHFISTVVLCGMVIQFLSADHGIINEFLKIFGIPAKNYMAYPEYFRIIYVLSGVWQHFGFNAILYMAFLTDVPHSLHEAAIIDGASLVKRIRYIDLPELLPKYIALMVLQCGSMLSTSSEKVLLFQNNINLGISEVISTYTYKVGLASLTPNYPYSAAIEIMTALVNIFILVSVRNIQRRMEAKWNDE